MVYGDRVQQCFIFKQSQRCQQNQGIYYELNQNFQIVIDIMVFKNVNTIILRFILKYRNHHLQILSIVVYQSEKNEYS